MAASSGALTAGHGPGSDPCFRDTFVLSWRRSVTCDVFREVGSGGTGDHRWFAEEGRPRELPYV